MIMRKLIVTLIVLSFVSSALNARTRVFDTEVVCDKDSVTVSFKVDASGKVPVRMKEVIMPFVYNGKDTVWLEPLEIFGRDKYVREKQENYAEGNRTWDIGVNQVLSGGIVSYVSKVPLKRWMTSADLGMMRHLTGCNCEKDYQEDTLKQDMALFETPVLPPRRIPEYVLEEAVRKWDMGQDELEVIFKVSKIQIDSSVFDNKVTFGKILDVVDRIHNDPNLRIEKLHVAGYASPEGSPKFNTWLGINRAKALIRYIIRERPEYGLTEDKFEIRNGEENWEGLRRVLVASDMPGKDEVIAVIDSVSLSGEAKKKAIKAMDGGRVWSRMLKEIYPHLRCARYLAVYYDSNDDLVIGQINEANAMICDGRYQDAYALLSDVADDGRALNSMGVALMMQGRFEEAEPWFEKAMAGGSGAAGTNMAAIKAEYTREAQQRKEIEEYLKKYD